MENQVDQQELNNQNNGNNLSEIFDILSGVGLVGGAIGSFFGNVAVATIPISFSLALQIANRRQLKVELSQIQESSKTEILQQINSNHTKILEQLQHLKQEGENSFNQQDNKFQNLVNELSNKIQANQESFTLLSTKERKLDEFAHGLQSKLNEVQDIVTTLQNIENFSQMIRTNPDEVEAYYQRGLNYQKLGEQIGAMEDYREALNLDSTYAEAYHSRGVLLAEIGQKKQAVEDLRLATKYYFEQGNIESYEQARNLSKEFYEVRHSYVDDEPVEMVDSQKEINEENSLNQVDSVTVDALFDDELDS
ncbi:tetratricopeptide repeat protein [Crocosphaera sp. Alani8]|uniref:tetratricopeptide repeat protein n=1 Tax=Crocosphaera sp. Alani8 TaxID=3038952 RepID=UPI00313C680A